VTTQLLTPTSRIQTNQKFPIGISSRERNKFCKGRRNRKVDPRGTPKHFKHHSIATPARSESISSRERNKFCKGRRNRKVDPRGTPKHFKHHSIANNRVCKVRINDKQNAKKKRLNLNCFKNAQPNKKV